MNIIGKIVLGILAVIIPIGLYRVSPEFAIALGILIVVFVFIGSLMDAVNESNDFVFSRAFKYK